MNAIKEAPATGTGTFAPAILAAALLDPEAAPPPGLKTWNGSDPAQRFAVYRNNVMHSLSEALAQTFDVVRQLLGDECFAATASVFIRQHPPRSPILATYGEQFADFLGGFAPLAQLPYLPDVARLEYLRVQSFHAADAPPLNREALAPLLADPLALQQLRVALHPSLHILRSDYALCSIWAAHQGHGDLADCNIQAAEAALVLRENDDAAVVAISHASAHFITRLGHGLRLGEAAHETLAMSFPDGCTLDLGTSLGLLLHHPATCPPLNPGKITS